MATNPLAARLCVSPRASQQATPSAVNIQVVGLILMLVGIAGLAMGQWLYFSRRRTDVIYRGNRQTWLEPNSPPRGHEWDRVD